MTSVDNRPLRVFLCHSSNDKPAVRALYQKLRAEPWIQPWLDEEELYPGQDWNMEIEKAVEHADAIIVCLTKNSINKEGYVQRELRLVLDVALTKPEDTIFVIPLRLEECELPRRLRARQYTDYFEGQRERALERLLVSLKKRADSLGLEYKPVDQVFNLTEIVSSIENQVESSQPPLNKNSTNREYYEKLIAQVEKHLKLLPKIAVYCLFRFISGDDELTFNPFEDKDRFDDANKALENGFLVFYDGFLINENDTSVSDAVKWVRKLEKYLKDTIDDDLYELLRSEYKFEPSLTNKRYWENYLYGKPLY